ncbi:4'-phosphopantetheinyl transferase family protein [Streptomyces pseudovenezuelae]|uniref:4'-phosphopantetheinyl transferase n=1 Tax=Streptomyces pseudovenezuelae TaxID=67350 RepID=A0ABT6LXI8_9ACTN|nr:4'-phosphopantetheinyl transferase superfamily protein [Streptomyces pseudovenezuelae]MDH6220154.1 4'-phosphopantetheinyl transferase [Streptomyces pseudovenezuelae]
MTARAEPAPARTLAPASALTPPRAPAPKSLVLACDLQAPGSEAAARAILPRLSTGDQERIARLGRPADRTRSVLARWLALQAASQLLGTPWTALGLGRRRLGTPYVVAQPHLSVSMAHSGRYAVAAVALGGRVGVDVEEISRVAALPDSAFLTPAEISALPPVRQGGEPRAMLWALKEAATKLTGEGLRAGMKRVGFRWRSGTRGLSAARTPYTAGEFTVCRLPGGYVCAVGMSASTPPSAPLFLETERSDFFMYPEPENGGPEPDGTADPDGLATAPRSEQDAEEPDAHIWLSVN